MAQAVRLQCAGLATDPSALIAGGSEGGLRLAENVIIDNPGVISPRPGFGQVQVVTPTDARPRSMVHFDEPGDPGLVVSEWDSVSTWGIRTEAELPDDGPLEWNISSTQFAGARKNMYWTSASGVRKICSRVDVASVPSGMHEAPSGTIGSNGAGAAVPDVSTVAYRWCFRKIDFNGVITKSAPSPWQRFDNASGGTVDVAIEVPLPDYVQAGDQIEIYRTYSLTPETLTPSDMLYLARLYTVTAADITFGYYAGIVDSCADNNLGEELYTNPTREGFYKGNGRPPACVALALWQGCMWHGYTVGPWTGVLNVREVEGLFDGSSTSITGLLYITRSTLSQTNGSPVITGFPSTSQLTPGMLAVSVNIPAGTTILTVDSGTQVTLSDNALATITGSASITFHDGVTIAGTTYWAASANTGGPADPIFFGAIEGDPGRTALNLARQVNYYNSDDLFAYGVQDPLGDATPGSLVVRSADLTSSIFAISVTRPRAFNYGLNTSGGVLVSRDERRNGVSYSKLDQPEHVPEVNFVTVGNELSRVLAFAPLRGALLVFKEDGIFRITGSGPDNWGVDVVEPNVRIVRGDAVAVLGQVAYAWLEGGVYEVDEGSARDISTGYVSRQLAPHAARALAGLSQGAWVVCWPVMDLVLVGIPSTSTAETDGIYAFCTTTGAWSRWDMTVWCAAPVSSSVTLYSMMFARGGARWEIRGDHAIYGSFKGYDHVWELSGWTLTSSSTVEVTSVERGDWVPKAGDWLKRTDSYEAIPSPIQRSEFRKIITVQPGASYTLTLESPWTLPSGGTTLERLAYEGIVSAVQWQAATAGSPAVNQLCREVHVALDWSAYATGIGPSDASALVGASSSTALEVATVEWSKTRAAYPTLDARVMMPREHARSTHLYPYVELGDIGIEWRIVGCSLVFEATGERTAR